ncbi:unnamed protein product [Closterium sp. NIES-65]|nr:unnamed protein product [Closterium sp. NIES-65]
MVVAYRHDSNYVSGVSRFRSRSPWHRNPADIAFRPYRLPRSTRFPPPSLTHSPTHTHASPHRRPSSSPPSPELFPTVARALPHRRPSSSPLSPELFPTVAHASPYRRSRFLLPSPTLPHIVAHPFLPPPSLTLPRSSPTVPPTDAHASPHRRSRFPPPSLTLPPTVAHASPHRRSRFPPPSPTLSPTIAHASPHRRPRFPSHRPPCRLEMSLPADLPSLPPLSTSSSVPCLSRSTSSSPLLLHPRRPPSHPFLSALGAAAALEQSAGRTAGAARAVGQQGAQCFR